MVSNIEELLAIKPVKRKKSKVYFGKDTQDAIIAFNDTASEYERQKLFSKLIYPAFDKLCENIINTWKFHRYETTYTDLKADAVTALYEKISGYKPDKGRAYSYFTIIARNFFFRHQSELRASEINSSELNILDEERNISNEIAEIEYKESLSDFIILWTDWMDENLPSVFKLKRDKKIVDAVLTIFRAAPDIDIYNKKMLYVMIREHSKCETIHITKVVKLIKNIFFNMFDNYRQTGLLENK